MVDLGDDEDIKDLLRKKAKLLKDPHKTGELGDLLFQIGYLYYQKAYYKEALEEFERCLDVRKKLNVSLDIATTHRFLGETLCKLGHNEYERAKRELDIYFSMTLRMNDLVEIQRAHTTLGNYFMALAEDNYKDNRVAHLNQAFSHYLDSYEILTDIVDRKLVDGKEFALMKARTCLNCAFVMDEKRDLVICNEYLKTAIDICEENHFYEDLIRCYYIKCDQAKRKGKMEDTLKVADRIIEVTQKTKDYVQQSSDFAFVADIYMKVQNFEKAKILLRKAYKLRKKCLISPDIGRKLNEVIKVVKLQKELGNVKIKSFVVSNEGLSSQTSESNDDERNSRLYMLNEKLGDAYCNLGLYDLGLNCYFEQLKISKSLNKAAAEMAVIYSSIAQTYQDLENYKDALKYYELELKTNILNDESAIKSLLNIAYLKEKCQEEFDEVKQVYTKALEKANKSGNRKLELKALRSLRDCEKSYGRESSGGETEAKVKEMQSSQATDEDDEDEEEDNEVASIVFSSDSDEDVAAQHGFNEEEKIISDEKFTRSKNVNKKYVVKRNLRGETQLHVACIRGNVKQAKKLLEEGHPPNERDNLNWLPIHEACNYGHKELVELLIKHGAKVNDLIGPITPLHDAAQNGHLEVVKLLLNAGALSYVFTKEGYTPLDFLVKYKQDNESSMTPFEIDLYQEIYNMMLNAIKRQDKCYKIKKVVFDEETSAVTDGNNVEIYEGSVSSSKSSSSKLHSKNAILYGEDIVDDDEEEDDDDDDEAVQTNSSNHGDARVKKKKKKAIVDYRSAMSSVGSKAVTSLSKSAFIRPKAGTAATSGLALVSENEYSTSENWLIDDMGGGAVVTSRPAAKTSSKPSSEFTSGSSIRGSNTGASNKRKHAARTLSNDLFDLDDIAAPSSTTTIDDITPMEVGEDKSTSRKSNEKIEEIVLDDSVTTRKKVPTSSSSSSSSKKRILDSEVIPISDLEISSPGFHQSDYSSSSRKNFNYSEKENVETITRYLERNEEKSKSDTSLSKQAAVEKIVEKTTTTVWKIKAVIDNRNFLIPLADINGKIDDLIVQILSRYKTIFSRDANYREPTKVLLKSSDDLILFGEDVIKDVLSDSAQVHVIIEAYKDAPKLDEVYENLGRNGNANIYANVKRLLRNSEANSTLELADIFADNREIGKQFELILNSIQSVSNSATYVKSLIKIDLSSNYLTDQVFIQIIENIISKTSSLRVLNLSCNLLTIKSVKTLLDCNRQCLEPLESLNLSGNEIGEESVFDLFTAITDLLDKCPNLSHLGLSDCKICLKSSTEQEIVLKRFMDKIISNSKLKSLDLSFNFIEEQIIFRNYLPDDFKLKL